MVILEYTPEPEAEEPYFEIDGTTGDLIALKQLDYTVDPHRYVVDVTATEQISAFTTTQQVCFYKQFIKYLPAVTKLWPRLCFYTCV